MAAAAVTTKKLCISALRQLQTQTRKYSNIVSIFETWYEEGGQDDETLRIEFADVIDESSFIEAARGKKEIRNDEEAQQIFNAIKNALTVPTEEKEQMSLPLLLLTTKLPDDWEKQLDSVDFELRESVKRQASKLVTGDGKGCMDVLRLYVHCILYDVVLCIPDVLPSMTNSEWLGKLYHRYNGTYPLLNHFVDAYTRCRVNEWIANNRKPINMSIATIFSPKYFCSHPEWKKGKHLDYVKTAVKSYTTRLVPEYSCIAFTYKLKTEPKDAVALLDVLFAAVEGVNRQLTWVNAEQNTLVEGSLVPFQFDLLILHHPSDLKKNEPMSGDALDFGSDSDSDEDEDEDDEEDESESDNPDEDQFDTLWHPKGKQEHNDFVEKLLEDNKIKFEIHSAVDPNQKLKGGGGDRLDRLMDAGLNEFVKLKRQRQRAILVADLSQVDEDGIRTNTRIFSVHPPKESAGFESFATLSPPALHMNSVKWILPKRKEANSESEAKVDSNATESSSDTYGVKDHLGGQMLVFSFHALSAEEVRCYMFYCGRCLRFYPNDIFHIIPELFVKSDGVRNEFLKLKNAEDDTFRRKFNRFKDTLKDTLFDEFYAGLLPGQSPDIEV